jgi:hypothetical protein
MTSQPPARPSVSVVVPAYRNAETLEELLARTALVLEGRSLSFEVIFVDDASPDRSFEVLSALAVADERVVVVRLPSNVGQHAAVLHGLRVASGAVAVVMDADLQDQPESIPELLKPTGYAAVFAGRRGRYESRARLMTSRAFKWVLSHIAGVPTDAGLFVLLTREMIDRLLDMPGDDPYVVAMIGCTGLPMTSVPIQRAPRRSGASAYSSRGRVAAAWRAVRWTLAWKSGWSRRAAVRGAQVAGVPSVSGGRFSRTNEPR